MRKALFFLAMLASGLSAASGDNTGPIAAVTPTEAHARVKSGEAVLVDVREPEEWAEGVAEGARLLPLSDLKADRSEWKKTLSGPREKELILYCRSGRRSAMAAEILAKEGFKVANAGGFESWEKAGLPVKKPEQK